MLHLTPELQKPWSELYGNVALEDECPGRRKLLVPSVAVCSVVWRNFGRKLVQQPQSSSFSSTIHWFLATTSPCGYTDNIALILGEDCLIWAEADLASWYCSGSLVIKEKGSSQTATRSKFRLVFYSIFFHLLKRISSGEMYEYKFSFLNHYIFQIMYERTKWIRG